MLREIYRRLYAAYGPQGWWPGGGPFDVVVGAILTQAAAWTNVERAIAAMKQADCWSIQAIHAMPAADLALIIRPSGYFNAKARKLKAFARHVVDEYAGDLQSFLSRDLGPLREELLSIHGIGPETADDILVYAAEKPSFVIDAYTRRIVQRLGLLPLDAKSSYQAYQDLFHANLDEDVPCSTSITPYWTATPRTRAPKSLVAQPAASKTSAPLGLPPPKMFDSVRWQWRASGYGAP